jgi:hypothetical protein
MGKPLAYTHSYPKNPKTPLKPQRSHAMDFESFDSENAQLPADSDEDFEQELQILQRTADFSLKKSAPLPPKPAAKVAKACEQFTIKGECSRGDSCFYSHDDKDCQALWTKISENSRFNRVRKTNDPFVPKTNNSLKTQSLTNVELADPEIPDSFDVPEAENHDPVGDY